MTMPMPAPRLIRVGDSLPRLTFRQIGASGTISWNQGTLASVVFVPHPAGCQDCARYGDQLGAVAAELAEWATRALVLCPGAADHACAVRRLADHDGAGRAQLGVGLEQAAVVQSDRYGAVYQAEVAGPGAMGHLALPAPHDLVALAKFIDIQCPECGIPSREWLGACPFPLG